MFCRRRQWATRRIDYPSYVDFDGGVAESNLNKDRALTNNRRVLGRAS